MSTNLKALPAAAGEPVDLEIWVALEPGKAIRARLALVEEAMPSPGEVDRVRQPYVGEVLAALHLTRSPLAISLVKPF